MKPEELKRIRRRADLTQAELGSKVGLTQGAICFYERGRVKIPRDMRARLRAAKVLKESP